MAKRFENKVVLVTGGARGMGARHVERFVEEGAKVYFTDILSEGGQELAERLGRESVFIQQDVAKEDNWKKVISIIEEQENKLDVLVNSAGVARHKVIGDMSLDEYMSVININQVSVFLGLTYALPLLKKGTNASVVNISSIAGIAGSSGGAAYSSSKYAVRGLTQVAALEFAPLNIRVNSIHPGVVETPMVVQGDNREGVVELVKAIPLGRIGKPDDISNMALYLASEDSSFCTASEFVLDGGTLAGF
jgi:3alpha(or 20beta)-hydroxysteroid dehydrogenase